MDVFFLREPQHKSQVSCRNEVTGMAFRGIFSEHHMPNIALAFRPPLKGSMSVRQARTHRAIKELYFFCVSSTCRIFSALAILLTLKMEAYPKLKQRLAGLLADESTTDVTFLVGNVGPPN